MALQTRKQIIVKAVAQRCSMKKVFLEISQNSQENTCARVSFLIKLLRCLVKEVAIKIMDHCE